MISNATIIDKSNAIVGVISLLHGFSNADLFNVSV